MLTTPSANVADRCGAAAKQGALFYRVRALNDTWCTFFSRDEYARLHRRKSAAIVACGLHGALFFRRSVLLHLTKQDINTAGLGPQRRHGVLLYSING
jgi:hypothetical protein